MADNGTENSSEITAQETDSSLHGPAVALLWLAQGLIDQVDRLLKGSELGHCVRDLPGPERVEALEQPAHTFLSHDLAPSIAEGMRVGRERRLHANLDRFVRAERDIREELGRSASTEEDQGAVAIGEQPLAIEVLEHLIKAVFPCSLERVTHEGRGPTEEDAAQAFLSVDLAPCGDVGGVDVGIDLTTTFYQVKGSDGRMRWSCENRQDQISF